MVNWTRIVSDLGESTVQEFARGLLSGENLYETALDVGSQETRSQIRNLLRSRGVTEARQLARKAVQRRVAV